MKVSLKLFHQNIPNSSLVLYASPGIWGNIIKRPYNTHTHNCDFSYFYNYIYENFNFIPQYGYAYFKIKHKLPELISPIPNLQ